MICCVEGKNGQLINQVDVDVLFLHTQTIFRGRMQGQPFEYPTTIQLIGIRSICSMK